MITTYERAYERVKLAGQVELALLQLEAKFGPLSVEVKQRIEALSPEEFRRTMIAFATAGSLKDLGLQIEDMGLGK